MKVTLIPHILVLAMAANTAAQAQYGGATGSDDGFLTLRATTPAESYNRGVADLMRSGGLYNLSTAEAALTAASAREHQMQNATAAINGYFQIRQMNREYRAASRRPRTSPEAIARNARATHPKPLNSSQFDTATGTLYWPVLLRTKDNDRYRIEVADFFARRALSDDVSTEDYLEFHGFAAAMKTDLLHRVRQVPSADYTEAKKFLDSLVYEARRPAAMRPDLALQR